MFPIETKDDMVIITSQDGEVHHNDVVETLSFLSEHPLPHKNGNLLIIDPGSGYNPSNNEYQQFTYLLGLLLENVFSRIALVVSREFHYGLGRMTEVISETEKGVFRVFKDEAKARDWFLI